MFYFHQPFYFVSKKLQVITKVEKLFFSYFYFLNLIIDFYYNHFFLFFKKIFFDFYSFLSKMEILAPIAQWKSTRPRTLACVGSIPAGGTIKIFFKM